MQQSTLRWYYCFAVLPVCHAPPKTAMTDELEVSEEEKTTSDMHTKYHPCIQSTFNSTMHPCIHPSINSTDYFKGGLNHEDVSFLFIVIKEFMLVNCIDSRTTRSTLLASVRLTVWHEKRCCWVKHTVYLNGNYICLVSTFSSTRYSCTIYKFKKYSLHWVPQPFRSLHDDKNSH